MNSEQQIMKYATYEEWKNIGFQVQAVIAQNPEWASDYYKLFKDQFTGPEQVIWLLRQ